MYSNVVIVISVTFLLKEVLTVFYSYFIQFANHIMYKERQHIFLKFCDNIFDDTSFLLNHKLLIIREQNVMFELQ